MADRRRKKFREKWDRSHIIGVLREHGELTYNDLYEQSDLKGKGTFDDRLKKLEQEGYVKREYQPSDKGRGKTVITLTEEALDPVKETLKRLDLVAGPYSRFDIETGEELLSDEVVEEIKRMYFPTFLEEKFGTDLSEIYSIFESVDSEEKPVFNEIVLLLIHSRYWAERITLREEPETLKMVNENEHSEWREHVKKLDLEEFFGEEIKIPNPAKGVPVSAHIKRRGLTREFDGLLAWLKPLLEDPNLASFLFWREHYYGHQNYRTPPNVEWFSKQDEEEARKRFEREAKGG